MWAPFEERGAEIRGKSRNMKVPSEFLFRVKRNTLASPNTGSQKADILSM